MFVNGQPKGRAYREERSRFVEEKFLASAKQIREAEEYLALLKDSYQPKVFTTRGKSTIEVLAFLDSFRIMIKRKKAQVLIAKLAEMRGGCPGYPSGKMRLMFCFEPTLEEFRHR